MTRSVAAIGRLLAVLVLGLGAGVGIGYAIFQPTATLAESRLADEQGQAANLRGDLESRDLRIEELLVKVSGLQNGLALATVERETVVAKLDDQRRETEDALATDVESQDALARVEGSLRAARSQAEFLTLEQERLAALRDSIRPMDSDRLLLVEIRKDMPTTLDEATAYWKGVRDLAVKSDPALGSKVSRVQSLVPAYFDWRETSFETSCGSVTAFFSSGASDLGTLRADLEKDVLLVLINRMDTALTRALD